VGRGEEEKANYFVHQPFVVRKKEEDSIVFKPK